MCVTQSTHQRSSESLDDFHLWVCDQLFNLWNSTDVGYPISSNQDITGVRKGTRGVEDIGIQYQNGRIVWRTCIDPRISAC